MLCHALSSPFWSGGGLSKDNGKDIDDPESSKFWDYHPKSDEYGRIIFPHFLYIYIYSISFIHKDHSVLANLMDCCSVAKNHEHENTKTRKRRFHFCHWVCFLLSGWDVLGWCKIIEKIHYNYNPLRPPGNQWFKIFQHLLISPRNGFRNLKATKCQAILKTKGRLVSGKLRSPNAVNHVIRTNTFTYFTYVWTQLPARHFVLLAPSCIVQRRKNTRTERALTNSRSINTGQTNMTGCSFTVGFDAMWPESPKVHFTKSCWITNQP